MIPLAAPERLIGEWREFAMARRLMSPDNEDAAFAHEMCADELQKLLDENREEGK